MEHLSLRDKSQMKRRITREHNSNFRAGHVQVHEEQLHKTGLRGRKTYLVYFLTCVLILLIVVNMLITLTIFGVLRLGKGGMASLELVPRGELLRFTQDSEFGAVYPVLNSVGGLADSGLPISAQDGQQVTLAVTQPNGSTVSVNSDSVTLTSQDHFRVTDPDTSRMVFSSDFSGHIEFPRQSNSVQLDEASVGRVTSDLGEDLNIESGGHVTLRGSEGLNVEGKDLLFSAQKDLNFTSGEGLRLQAPKGLFLSQVGRIPTASASGPTDFSFATYKVCLCMPTGKLFLVPATYRCDQANEDKNPCA